MSRTVTICNGCPNLKRSEESMVTTAVPVKPEGTCRRGCHVEAKYVVEWQRSDFNKQWVIISLECDFKRCSCTLEYFLGRMVITERDTTKLTLEKLQEIERYAKEHKIEPLNGKYKLLFSKNSYGDNFASLIGQHQSYGFKTDFFFLYEEPS